MFLVNRPSDIGSYENADMKTAIKEATTLSERMKLARAFFACTKKYRPAY